MNIDKTKFFAILGLTIVIFGFWICEQGLTADDLRLSVIGSIIITQGLIIVVSADCDNLRNKIKELEERIDNTN